MKDNKMRKIEITAALIKQLKKAVKVERNQKVAAAALGLSQSSVSRMLKKSGTASPTRQLGRYAEDLTIEQECEQNFFKKVNKNFFDLSAHRKVVP